ncbi:MAG: hypothetical protein WD036_08965 [Bauldia sp.]
MPRRQSGSRTKDDAFRISRALALEAYAKVESELSYLLSAVIGGRHDTAAIIFFKIGNTGARNAIISSLLEHIHGDKYDTYWHGQPGGGGVARVPGLLSLINSLDTRRNEIVHWHPTESVSLGPDGSTKHWEDLRPAFFWARGNATPIATDDFDEFTAKAQFVEKSLQMLWRIMRSPQKVSEVELQSWTQIFQQPVPYPPPSAHPLAQKPQE